MAAEGPIRFEGWNEGTFVYTSTEDDDAMNWVAHVPRNAQVPMEYRSSDVTTHHYAWQPNTFYSWDNLRADLEDLEKAMDQFALASPWHGTVYQTAQRIRHVQEKIAVAKNTVAAGEIEYTGNVLGPQLWLDRMLYRTIPKPLFCNLLTEKRSVSGDKQRHAEQCHAQVIAARQVLVNHQTVLS
jgi:hypothetical protein